MGISSFNDVVERTEKSIVILTILTSIVTATLASSQQIYPSESIQQLPFCGDGDQRSINRRLLYVTTLDGKFTALDISKNGTEHWSIKTEPGSLISSSIHRLELTNNGQWVRMIPSLNGVLYKFDGETIDPIPITVDNLLSSSFKFSDDLVISGGKETRSYGVSARTGQILYECSMQGCVNSTDSISGSNVNDQKHDNLQYDDDNETQHDPLLDDVVVVRRQTQTVRAIEPRSGAERWNFSVGNHELELLQSPECHEKLRSNDELKVLEIDIKVIVPDGILLAFNRNNPKNVLWKYKFNHPIVSVWRVDYDDSIQSVDLFDSAQWIWNNEEESFVNSEGWVSPSLYVGMFRKQLYIQESKNLLSTLITKTFNLEHNLLNHASDMPSIPWKPMLATISSSSLALPGDTRISLNDDNDKVTESDETENEDNSAVTALSVLYASEYVNGNGFFLFSSSDNNTNMGLCDSSNSTTTTTNETNEDYDFEFMEDDTPVKIIIVSLWFWWKEIIVISLTSALVLNLFLSPRIRREREVVVIERHIPVPTAIEATEESVTSRSRSSQRSLSESNSCDSNGQFKSRFLTDFDLVQCLGKGGFGVVFEAKNKIDDCNYAVKRICLPNKKESRDRVMREVKTLANCEHKNIVRYFQSWIENPPPGWQEEEDKKWLHRDFISTSIEIETPDGTTLPPFSNNSAHSCSKAIVNRSDYNGNDKLDAWITNLKDPKYVNGYLNKDCKNSSHYTEHNSCSFIEFKADSDDGSCSNNADDESDDDDSKSSENAAKNVEINIHGATKKFGPPQIELDEDYDCSNSSSGIVFKAPSIDGTNVTHKNLTCTKNSIEKSSISTTTSSSTDKFNSKKLVPKINRHKRPMSLDLSSKGNVIVPVAPKPHQQQQQTKVYLYIQMQLCHKESLRDWLRKNKIEMRTPHIQPIFHQIIDAVGYVHLKGLIHRDLKPSNIFFSLDGQIKIGDFGLVTDMPTIPSIPIMYENNRNGISSYHRDRYTQQVGTHLYMSPEQLRGEPYDNKVDIYSLGLILFELLVYFSTEMERITTLKGLRDGQFPSEFDVNFPNEYELLTSMLSSKPNERPTTFQIKEKLFAMKPSVNSAGRTTFDPFSLYFPSTFRA